MSKTCDRCGESDANALNLSKRDGLYGAIIPLVQRFTALCDDCRDTVVNSEYKRCEECGRYVLNGAIVAHGKCGQCINATNDYWSEQAELATQFWRR